MADGHGNWFERLLGAGGLALGVAAVVFAVSGWTIPAGGESLGSDLFFSSGPTGELEVVPSGPFLRTRGLRPGDRPAAGTVTLRNQTGSTLGIRVHALPDLPDLDGLLRVRILAGSRVVFRGTLGDLAAETGELVETGPGARARLRFEVWLPAGLEHGYQGRLVSVPIQLDAEPL